MLREALPLLAAPRPKARRERLISPQELRYFLGDPPWKRWQMLLRTAGVVIRKGKPIAERGRGKRCAGLTREECRRVMETWYREVGEWRMKRWRGQ